MDPVTVLITAAGGAGAPGIIRSLRDNGERPLRVVATDTSPLAVGLHLADLGCVVPPADAPDYVECLLAICQREHVQVVLPGISHELQRLAQKKTRFTQSGIRVAVPDPETLERMDNKARLYETLTEHGVNIAPWLRVETLAALKPAVRALGYPHRPVVLKPQVGSGGRGFSVLDPHAQPDPEARDRARFLRWTLDQAFHYYAERPFPALVAMVFLGGPEYSADLLVDHGRTRYCLPRTRDVVRLGTSTVARMVHEPDVSDLCARIAACFDYGGNMNVQLLRDEQGTLWPSEVNPRLSGTVVFATECGVNLSYFGVKYHLGEPIPHVEPRWGRVLLRHFTEVVVDSWPGAKEFSR